MRYNVKICMRNADTGFFSLCKFSKKKFLDILTYDFGTYVIRTTRNNKYNNGL